MGCDIHIYVEERIDGEWQICQKPGRNPYYISPEEHIRRAEGAEKEAQYFEEYNPFEMSEEELAERVKGLREKAEYWRNPRGSCLVNKVYQIPPKHIQDRYRAQAAALRGDTLAIGNGKDDYAMEIGDTILEGEMQIYNNYGDPYPECVSIYDAFDPGRNYTLFSILAGVRNYGHEITPISEPRGLPSDVTPEIKAKSNYWGVDGHSHSWLTVKELKEYPWLEPHRVEGTVGEYSYVEYTTKGHPGSWSASVGGNGIATVDEETMKRIIELRLLTGTTFDIDNWVLWEWEKANKRKEQAAIEKDLKRAALIAEEFGEQLNTLLEKRYYTRISWEVRNIDHVDETWLEMLYNLNPKHPEDVRLVFWFDN